MPGKSSIQRQALEAVKSRILPVFETGGYEFITPDILQPADVFLDRSGEDIRARTFVFTDPEGRELCLRPDLTVPTCRYHLERHVDAPETEKRYCYWGPAFRFQSTAKAQKLKPQEFDQTGIEWFGAPAKPEADAAMLALSLQALKAAGLKDYQVQMGDLGLFHGLLDSIDMPQRWRRRLKHHFWRPRAFRNALNVLSGVTQPLETSVTRLIDEIAEGEPSEIADFLTTRLQTLGVPIVGGRDIAEIAERFSEKIADRRETPLPRAEAERINAYLGLRGHPIDVSEKLKALAGDIGGSFAQACDAFFERLELFHKQGLDAGQLTFASVFGRSLEYYTGFVFQVEKAGSDDVPMAVAGGGRYDNMLSDIGSPIPVAAVGCAVHVERLLHLLARQNNV